MLSIHAAHWDLQRAKMASSEIAELEQGLTCKIYVQHLKKNYCYYLVTTVSSLTISIGLQFLNDSMGNLIFSPGNSTSAQIATSAAVGVGSTYPALYVLHNACSIEYNQLSAQDQQLAKFLFAIGHDLLSSMTYTTTGSYLTGKEISFLVSFGAPIISLLVLLAFSAIEKYTGKSVVVAASDKISALLHSPPPVCFSKCLARSSIATPLINDPAAAPLYGATSSPPRQQNLALA